MGALHGLILVPGGSNAVEVLGCCLLCYPEDATEADLRAAVVEWFTRDECPRSREMARSYVDLVITAEGEAL